MQVALKKLMAIMPFLFGIGFIAPLLAQVMEATGQAAPFDIDRMAFALVIGAGWGLVANIRGRWL